jgi:UDP-galactopyranose mutase
MIKYDYLIIGSGFFGSVFAYEAKKHNKKVLVLEKRNHIGGNAYTQNINNITVHTYGPHIFNTNSKKIWDYINQFAEFNQYCHKPKVFYKNKIYSFPINLMTLNQLWGINTPEEAIKKLNEVKVNIPDPQNLEEWILSQVGKEIYETFIYGYTKKQWKKEPKDLPSFIIKRLPIRTNFNDNYYFSSYQGIPKGGYTQIFDKLLDGIEVKLNTEFEKLNWEKYAHKLVYTGKIDEFYDYKLGELEYLTLRFDNKEHSSLSDFQGTAVMNYTDENIPYTRITEHKHFENTNTSNTIISYEYPDTWNKSKIPYYPINNKTNQDILSSYNSVKESKVLFGGRLANYQYLNMDQTMASSLETVKKENW